MQRACWASIVPCRRTISERLTFLVVATPVQAFQDADLPTLLFPYSLPFLACVLYRRIDSSLDERRRLAKVP